MREALQSRFQTLTRISDNGAQLFDRWRPVTREERAAADAIRTLVFPLGPYRNLTTLMAALFAFHPEAIVLNHGGKRIFRTDADPFATPHDAHVVRFKQRAVRMLQSGKRRAFGGNVLLSHAFDRPNLQDGYRARFGDTVLKPGAQLLFWKDSMRIQNQFDAPDRDMRGFIDAVPGAKFILPIRNPMDCAVSNLKTGHRRHLVPGAGVDFDMVLEKIVEKIAVFRDWERAHPDRFFSFTERELGGDFPARLARFCGVSNPPAWQQDAAMLLRVEGGYPHDRRVLDLFSALVARKLGDDAEMAARLLAFAGPRVPG